MDCQKNKIKTGFTLIETLVAMLILGLASSAFFLGIVQAQLSMESIKVKEEAYQELKSYTENIKSLVAAGVTNFGQQHANGQEVVLRQDPKSGRPLITGRLYKTVIKCDNGSCPNSEDSGDYSVYYYIHTHITWHTSAGGKEKIFFQKISDSENINKLEFKTYQIRVNT